MVVINDAFSAWTELTDDVNKRFRCHRGFKPSAAELDDPYDVALFDLKEQHLQSCQWGYVILRIWPTFSR